MYSVLYVDDDKNLLGLHKIFMEKSGTFKIDTASSAAEALDRIKDTRYDAILSDYQMPEMDGIEFLKLVRSRHGNLPFILFTGRGREDVVIEAVNNGVDYYIQKGPDFPAMIAELRHKIVRAIERRQFEGDLKKSRQQLTDIINFLPDATCVIDTAGRVISWNRAMEIMTGIPQSEMIGKGDYAYAIPFYGKQRPVLMNYLLNDQLALESGYPVVEKTGGKINAEIFLPFMNKGTGAYVWACASLLYDSAGNVTGAVETVRDMTDVHRIQHDLSISREMNLGFANMLPVVVYEMDPCGILTFSNRLALSWFGITEDDVMLKIRILDYIVPEDRDRAFRDIRQVLAGAEGTGQEYLLQRKDGTTFPGLIYAGVVTDPETGQVTGLRGIILDLTLRKQEAQALHESRERLKLAVTAGDLGIWDVDLRTMAVHDINEWANRALDLSFEDSAVITITQCKTLVHPLDLPRILFAFFRHVALKAPLFEVEFRLPHRDGSWRWVAVRGKVIERNARNEPVRFTGTINTIAPPKESRYLLSGPQ